MSNKEAASLPDPQDAYNQLYRGVHAEVFLGKLASYGIQPTTEKEAADLFAIAGQLNPESCNSASVVIDNCIQTFCGDVGLFNYAKRKFINTQRWAEVSPELRSAEKLSEILCNYKSPDEKFLEEEITYDLFKFYMDKLGCFTPSKFTTFILK